MKSLHSVYKFDFIIARINCLDNSTGVDLSDADCLWTGRFWILSGNENMEMRIGKIEITLTLIG